MKKIFLKLTSFSLIVGLAFGLSACTAAPSNHYIGVSSSNIRAGTVSGFGNYKTDYDVTLSALPLENNTFLAWIKNDIIVSYDQEYSFKASQETEGDYCALFTTPQIEFFKLSNISYNATGIGLENPEYTINKILNIDISWSQISTLYSPFASFNEALVGNSGNFSSSDFNIKDYVLFKNNIYYFKTTLILEYSNIAKETQIAEVSKKFAIDFSKLNEATGENGILTYDNFDYTIIQTTENNKTTISVIYKNLPLTNDCVDTMAHNLVFNFEYPFEKPADDESSSEV